jgi:hypothetical protein
MNLSFLPNRETMLKEIEQWIILRKLDTLLGVCNCCMYKVFDFILTQECRTCTVRSGILRIVEEKRREARSEDKFLGVC